MRSPHQIVADHYAASDRRDLDGMLADLADHCQWTEMAGSPCAGTYVGVQAIIQNVFAGLAERFDGFTFTLERLIDAGDEVIGIGHYSGTHRQNGQPFRARTLHLWQVKHGKIIRFEQFADTAMLWPAPSSIPKGTA